MDNFFFFLQFSSVYLYTLRLKSVWAGVVVGRVPYAYFYASLGRRTNGANGRSRFVAENIDKKPAQVHFSAEVTHVSTYIALADGFIPVHVSAEFARHAVLRDSFLRGLNRNVTHVRTNYDLV